MSHPIARHPPEYDRLENLAGERAIDRAHRATRRCGICLEAIATGQPTRYMDDERCHADCAREVGEQS